MDEMLKKLMERKKAGKMPAEYKSAKMGVLKDLHGEMSKLIGDDLKGMKKVTVASPDTEGLKMGLEKAEELVEGKLGDDEESEDMAEMGESEEAEESEESEEEMSPKEIEEKIAELQALKAKLAAKV